MKKLICTILLGLVISTAVSAEIQLPPPKSEKHATANKTEISIPKSSAKPLDKIVAIVNDSVITQSELNIALMRFRIQLNSSHARMPNKKSLRNTVLQKLINQKLQLQLSKKLHLKITSEQVTTEIEKIAKRNHVTIAELQQKLKERGYTYSDYRQLISDQMMIALVQRRLLASKLTISKTEIAAFKQKLQARTQQVKQYQVEDILIPLASNATARQIRAAKSKALSIKKQLQAGGNFKAATRSTTINELGWRGLSDLPDLFANAVKKMRKGSYAGPLQAANGFHIIHLSDTRASPTKKLNDKEIQELVFKKKFSKVLKDWLVQLRHTAYIKILDNNGANDSD